MASIKQMKRFRLTIEITSDDKTNAEDIMLLDSDVIDGFEISRRGSNTTEVFHFKSGVLIDCKQIKY